MSDSSSRHIPPLQVLSVSARCFLCLLPFVIFQEWPAHTCVIVRVYDLSSLVPAYARTHVRTHAGTHTHRGTVCRCSARHSLRHTAHIYSFTTMSHCLTKDSTFSPPHHQPQAWAAVCKGGWWGALLLTLCVLLCFTSKCPATPNTLQLQKTDRGACASS